MPSIHPNKSRVLSCRQVIQIMPDYLDQQLDSTATNLVQGHLLRCDLCTSELNAFLLSEKALRSASLKVSVPADLLAQFSRRLAEQQLRTSSSWRRPLILAPLAAAGLLIWIAAHQTLIPVKIPVNLYSQNAESSAPLRLAERDGTGADSQYSHIHANKVPILVARADRAETITPSSPILRKRSNSITLKTSPKSQVNHHYSPAESLLNTPSSVTDSLSTYRTPPLNYSAVSGNRNEAALPDPAPEVDLVVHDDERGFTSSTRIARIGSPDGDSEVVRFTEVDASTMVISPPQEAE